MLPQNAPFLSLTLLHGLLKTVADTVHDLPEGGAINAP
jgi:hypothetical protein